MKPDIERYRRYVDQFDLGEAEKTELIHTVWNILQNGFDRAFEDDPVHHARSVAVVKNAARRAPMLEFEQLPTTSKLLTQAFQMKDEKQGGEKI